MAWLSCGSDHPPLPRVSRPTIQQREPSTCGFGHVALACALSLRTPPSSNASTPEAAPIKLNFDGALLETVRLLSCRWKASRCRRTSSATNPKSSTRPHQHVHPRDRRPPKFGFDRRSAPAITVRSMLDQPEDVPVLVREGTRLSQVRFRRAISTARRLLRGARLHDKARLADDADTDLSDGVSVGVDLGGFRPTTSSAIGQAPAPIDRRREHRRPRRRDFWEPIRRAPAEPAARSRRVLHPGLQGGGGDPGDRPPR